MAHALLWIRTGFHTVIGLVVIGLAAVDTFESDPEAPSMLRSASGPHG